MALVHAFFTYTRLAVIHTLARMYLFLALLNSQHVAQAVSPDQSFCFTRLIYLPYRCCL